MGEEVKRLVVGLRTGQVNVDLFCGQFKKLVERRVSLTSGNLFAQLSNLRQAIDIYAAVRPSLPNNNIVEAIGKELFIICARVLLSVPFLTAPKHLELSYFRASVTKAEAQLRDNGHGHRFAMLKWLMEFNWKHPVLQALITGKKISEDLAMQYITKAEFPEVFRLRVEMLLEEGDHDLALNLCLWCSEDSFLALDPFIRASELILLFNRGHKNIFFEKCRAIHSCSAVEILQSVDPDARCNKGYLTMAQCFFIQEWLRPCIPCSYKIHRYCCTKALLELWLEAEYLQEPSIEEFQLTVSQVVQRASSTFQLMLLVDTLYSMFGLELLGMMLNICRDTLLYNRQHLEKTIMVSEMESERIMGTLAYVCITLARISSDWSNRLRNYALLSAITLEPREDVLFALMADRNGKKDGQAMNVLLSANQKANYLESDVKSDPSATVSRSKTPVSVDTSVTQLYQEGGVWMLPGGVMYDVVLDIVRSLEMLRLPSLNPNQPRHKLLSNCVDHLRESEVSLSSPVNIPQENILMGSSLSDVFDPLDLLYKKPMRAITTTPNMSLQTVHIPQHAPPKIVSPTHSRTQVTSQLTTVRNVSQPPVMRQTSVPITPHSGVKVHPVSLPSTVAVPPREQQRVHSAAAPIGSFIPPVTVPEGPSKISITEGPSKVFQSLPTKMSTTSNSQLASELAKPVTALPMGLKKQSHQMVNRLPDHLLECINNAPLAVSDKMMLLQQSDPEAVTRLLQQMTQKQKPALIDLTDEADTESDEDTTRASATIPAVSSLAKSVTVASGVTGRPVSANVRPQSVNNATLNARGTVLPGTNSAALAMHSAPVLKISRPNSQVPSNPLAQMLSKVVNDHMKPIVNNSQAKDQPESSKNPMLNIGTSPNSFLTGLSKHLPSPSKISPSTVPVVSLPKTFTITQQVSPPSLATVVTTTPNIALSLPHILPSKDMVLPSSAKPLSGTPVASTGVRLPPFSSTAKTLTVSSDRSQNALSQCVPVGSVMNTTLPQSSKSHSVSSQKSKVHLTPSRLEAALRQQQQQIVAQLPRSSIISATSTKASPKRVVTQTESVVPKSPRVSSVPSVVQSVSGMFMPTGVNQVMLQQGQPVLSAGQLGAQAVLGGQTVFDGQQMLAGQNILSGQSIIGAQSLFGGQTLVGSEGLIAGQNVIIQGHDGVLYQTPTTAGVIASQRGMVLQQPGMVIPSPQQSVIIQSPGDLQAAGALQQVLVASDDGTSNIVFLQSPQLIQSPQLPQLGQLAGQATAIGQLMQTTPQLGQVAQATQLAQATHLAQATQLAPQLGQVTPVLPSAQVGLPGSPAMGQVIHSPQLGQIAPSPQLCLMQSPQPDQLAPSPQLTQLPQSPCRVLQSSHVGQVIRSPQLNPQMVQTVQTAQFAESPLVNRILPPAQSRIGQPAVAEPVVQPLPPNQTTQPEQVMLLPVSSGVHSTKSFPKSLASVVQVTQAQQVTRVSDVVHKVSNVVPDITSSEVAEDNDGVCRDAVISDAKLEHVTDNPVAAHVLEEKASEHDNNDQSSDRTTDIVHTEQVQTSAEATEPYQTQSGLDDNEQLSKLPDNTVVHISSESSQSSQTTQEESDATEEAFEMMATDETPADADEVPAGAVATDEVPAKLPAEPLAADDMPAGAAVTNEVPAEAVDQPAVLCTSDAKQVPTDESTDVVSRLSASDMPAESTDDDDTLPASPTPEQVADGDSTQDGSDATVCEADLQESSDITATEDSVTEQATISTDTENPIGAIESNGVSQESHNSNTQLELDIAQTVSHNINDIIPETVSVAAPQLPTDVSLPEQSSLNTDMVLSDLAGLSPSANVVTSGVTVLPQTVDSEASAVLAEPGDEAEASCDVASGEPFIGESAEGQDLLAGLTEEDSLKLTGQLPELGGQLNLQDTGLPMTTDMAVNEGGQNPEEDFNKISQHVQKQVEEMLKNVPSDGEEHEENRNPEEEEDLVPLPLDQEAQKQLAESEEAGGLDFGDVLNAGQDALLPAIPSDAAESQENVAEARDKVTQQNQEVVPVTVVAEATDASLPAAVTNSVSDADAAPENVDDGLENIVACPENVDTIPENAEVGPETVDTIPENAEVGPETVDTIPENAEVGPETADTIDEDSEVVETVECSDVSIQCDMPEEDEVAPSVPDQSLEEPAPQSVVPGSEASATTREEAHYSDDEAAEEEELKESDKSMEVDSDGEISFKDSSLLKLPSSWDLPETPTDEEPDTETNQDKSESPEAKESPQQEEGRQRLRRSTRTKVSYEEIPLHLPAVRKLPKKDGEVSDEKSSAKITRGRKSRSSSIDKNDVTFKKKTRADKSAEQTEATEAPQDNKTCDAKPDSNAKEISTVPEEPPQQKASKPEQKEDAAAVAPQLLEKEGKETEAVVSETGNASSEKAVEEKKETTASIAEEQQGVKPEQPESVHSATPSPKSVQVNRNPVRLPRLPRDQLLGQTQPGPPQPMTSSEKHKQMTLISQEAIARVQASISQGDDMNKFQDSLIKALEDGITKRNFLERPQLQVSKDLNSLTILLFYEAGRDPLRLIVKTKIGGPAGPQPTGGTDKVVKAPSAAANRPQVYNRVVTPTVARPSPAPSPNSISGKSLAPSPVPQNLLIPSVPSKKSVPENVSAASHPSGMAAKRQPPNSAPRAAANSPVPGKISPKAKIIVNTVKKVPKRDAMNNNKPGEEKNARTQDDTNEGPAEKKQKVISETVSQDKQVLVGNEVKPKDSSSKSPPCAQKPRHNLKDYRIKKPNSQPQSPRSRPLFTVRTVISPRSTSSVDNKSVASHVKPLDAKASTTATTAATSPPTASMPKFEKEYERWVSQRKPVASVIHRGFGGPQVHRPSNSMTNVSNTSTSPKAANPSARPSENTSYLMSYENWFKGKTYNSTKSIKANIQKNPLQIESPPAAVKARMTPAEEAFIKIVQKDKVEVKPSSAGVSKTVSGGPSKEKEVKSVKVNEVGQETGGKGPASIVHEPSKSAKEINSSKDNASGNVKKPVRNTQSNLDTSVDNQNAKVISKSGLPSKEQGPVSSPGSVGRRTTLTRSSRDSSTEPESKKRCLRDSSVEPRCSQERSVSPAVRTTRSRHPSTSSTDSGSKETRARKRLSEPEASLRLRGMDTRNTRSSLAKSPGQSSTSLLSKRRTLEPVRANTRSSATRRLSAPSKRS